MQSLCVRFATTVASGHATLATKRTLLLTWAGLPPAGSHQLCLAHSFDHLVGAREQRGRNFKAEYPRGLSIDDHLERRRLNDRQVRGFGALEDAAGICAGLTISIRNVASVGHQPAGFGKFTRRICRWNRVAHRQKGQLETPALKERVRA